MLSSTEFYPLPACRVYLRGGTGYFTSHKNRTLTTELPEYKLRAYNNWTDHVFDSINWTAYRSASSILTDNVRTFAIKLRHDWLPVGVRERRCGATTDICPRCTHSETIPQLYLRQSRTTWRDQFITQLQKHLIDTSTAADLYCIIVQGIQNWFLTILQALFFRTQGLDAKYYNGELWTSPLIAFFWTQSQTL
jgi:hypothetical protein